MKEIITLAFLSSLLLSSFTISIDLDKFRPPGTVEIVENFFMDAGEIRNDDWKDYLEDLKTVHGENSNVYLQALPDLEVWSKEGFDNSVYADTYFSHPSYDDYPVVGITHQQAIDYCNWRTEAVSKMLKRNGIASPKKFTYRLPTRTEWELVALADFNKKQKKLWNKQLKKYGEQARRYNMLYDTHSNNVATMITAPTRSYLPNKHGIYNIYGNVAEMVAEPGIAMGGSYRHYHKEIIPTNKDVSYNCPEVWLGFRCVCEIIEE